MDREQCESEIAPSIGKRGSHLSISEGAIFRREFRFSQSWQLAGMDADFVFVGVLTYYLKRCAPC